MEESTRQDSEPTRFLAQEFERRIQSNPRYSLRAFARDLSMSPGAVSEVLGGRRRLTPKALVKISKKIGLNATETEKLIGASTLESSGLERLSDEAKEISDDLFRIVSDWYYFAILNLFDTEDLRPDAVWISRRLGITSSEAKLALDRLERVGLLVRVKGKLKVSSSFVMSTSGVPSSAIRKYHRQILEKAILALETEPVDERDITGIGLAIDLLDLPDLVAEIRKFRNRIASKYSRGKRTEVYQLEMALFKISKKIR